MTAPLRVTDDALLAAYNASRSIHAVGRTFGIHASSVHERLQRLGVEMRGNGRRWTVEDDARLERDFATYADVGHLRDLARDMGRTLPFLSRQAKRLGLTDVRRPKPWQGRWKHLTDEQARLLFDEFKASSLPLGQWLAKKGWPDDGFRARIKRDFPDEWEAVIEAKAPASSPYRLGRAVEYAVRDDLTRRGFFCLRSPASRSPLDVVAIARGLVLFVQAKRSGVLAPGEWNDLYDLAESVGAVPVLASRPTGRGLVYQRLVGRKDGSRRTQPFEAFTPVTEVLP